jgi:ferredoxin-NADP reductase
MWALQPGEGIEISGPDNHFELGLAAPSYTLVAGGVGITPLLGMARFLVRRGRPLHFHYSVRSREEAAFAELLRAWLGEAFHLCVESESGRLDFAQIIEPIPAEGELYFCGPIGMLEAARKAWEAGGRPASLLRYESFASSGHYANQPFTAVLPRFGRELQVPAHQTLLSALEEAGIEVLADCRRGECGLCAIDILACDAPVDHRDVFFSEEQKAGNRKLCACVSRPAGGRIEIDTAYRGPVTA